MSIPKSGVPMLTVLCVRSLVKHLQETAQRKAFKPTEDKILLSLQENTLISLKDENALANLILSGTVRKKTIDEFDLLSALNIISNIFIGKI